MIAYLGNEDVVYLPKDIKTENFSLASLGYDKIPTRYVEKLELKNIIEETEDLSDKKKFYGLVEFPYPFDEAFVYIQAFLCLVQI